MNILILTAGSRNDVQPYVALGTRLKSAGHTVVICTSATQVFEPRIVIARVRHLHSHIY